MRWKKVEPGWYRSSYYEIIRRPFVTVDEGDTPWVVFPASQTTSAHRILAFATLAEAKAWCAERTHS